MVSGSRGRQRSGKPLPGRWHQENAYFSGEFAWGAGLLLGSGADGGRHFFPFPTGFGGHFWLKFGRSARRRARQGL